MSPRRTKTSRFAEALAEAAAAAFGGLRASHPDERFYFFGLFTTEEGSYVVPTASSEEALARVAVDYQRRFPERSAEEWAKALRFSAGDAAYHDVGGEAFPRLDEGPALHDACFEALERLEGDGLFGRGPDRERVIVNVVYGDMSHERWLAHAVRLNPPRAVEAALPFLHLHLPSGRVSAWGRGAYQVNALSLSADRTIIAYAGSGGEVGVLRVADRHPFYEKRRRGQHWACALSPDGTRLYLGDAGGIGVLDCATGKYRSLVETGKPGAIALSPDGARIVATSFDAPLTVFDSNRGTVIWTRAGLGSAPAAFSPCGRWLAVAEPSFDPERPATLWCLDASTGDPVWSAPLGVGRDVSLAWTPEGDAILAAASTWTFSPDAVRTSSASLAFHAREDGRALRAVPWSGGIDAVAIAPSGERIALCSDEAVVVLDRSGVELARGTGAHESLISCAFIDDDTVVAAGRDVNEGPALLSLSLG